MGIEIGLRLGLNGIGETFVAIANLPASEILKFERFLRKSIICFRNGKNKNGQQM